MEIQEFVLEPLIYISVGKCFLLGKHTLLPLTENTDGKATYFKKDETLSRL